MSIRFTKQMVDIIERRSTATGRIIDYEYLAKSEGYYFGKSFEVSKTTILRGIL